MSLRTVADLLLQLMHGCADIKQGKLEWIGEGMEWGMDNLSSGGAQRPAVAIRTAYH